jgi:hypothetical protein
VQVLHCREAFKGSTWSALLFTAGTADGRIEKPELSVPRSHVGTTPEVDAAMLVLCVCSTGTIGRKNECGCD